MPVDVFLRPVQVVEEGKRPDNSHSPVEEVKAAAVQACTLEPPSMVPVPSGPVHCFHQERGQQRCEPNLTPEQRCGDGLHAPRRLAVEELEEAGERRDVREAQQEELRREPEQGHPRRRSLSLSLDNCRDD